MPDREYAYGMVDSAGGQVIYFINEEGDFHRINGPAFLSETNQCCLYYQNGKYHRDDGPAVERPWGKEWYKHGKRHRLEGPAVMTGLFEKEYWIEGKQYSNRISFILEKLKMKWRNKHGKV